jgi:DNA repair protein RadA
VIKFFRAEYIGRGTLADRQQRLSVFLNDCQKFATKRNAIVILINQVTANPDALFGPTLKPVGGNILGHAATYRISLKKKAGIGNRTFTIVDAPDLPPVIVPFVITNQGISEDDADSDR